MKEFKRYTVTSALPYANGPLHVGHISGAYLPADIYVRYLRLKGKDVAFMCGSDEHGAAITIQAKKEGVSPKEIIDKYHQLNKDAFEQLGISFDMYHRTSSELHHKTAQEYFTQLNDKGIFEVQESEQYYDEEYKQFLADRYITGTCPKCDNENAYGDQCEKCGTSLSPKDLINPVSTLSGNSPTIKKTKLWYLPLNKHEDWLKEWIVEGKGQTEKWKKNVLGQCRSWLEDGLHPRAITRDLDWGVKVPLEEADGKVLYVWLDAPIGYISATKQWASDKGIDWEPYWKDEDTKLLHFIGKDNIVFHCIIFPAILKSMGGHILPTNVPGNEFMNYEGDKMSTSRQWAVGVMDYMNDFPGRVDELRCVLTSNIPEAKDSEFTWKDYQDKVNSLLVGGLGNFINRVVVLTNKYFEGKVPTAPNWENESDNELLNAISKKDYAQNFEAYRFREAMQDFFTLVAAGDKYLASNEPWRLIKTDEAATAKILTNALQAVANLGILCYPFMPDTSTKIFELLNIDIDKRTWDNLGKTDLISEGHKIGAPTHLFKRVEDADIEQQVQKLETIKMEREQGSGELEYEPMRDAMVFDDFMKMDLRVATILEAEKVPKTDKLLKIKLDVGFETRTVVSGIAEYYNPEDIIGQQVSLVANLAPRKLRGIESKGMILMAKSPDNKMKFVAPSGDIANGSVIN